jgi:hypothetical protein
VVNSLLQGVLINKEGFTILDIGCGDIFFISELSKIYPKSSFYAIDIAFTDDILESLQNEIKNKNIYLFKSIDEALAHLKKPADLVLLLDVVEHIEYDEEFLKSLSINKSIDSDTKIIITVPAYQSLFCSHDHFLGHFRRYTNSSLNNVIEKSGFTKIKLGYFFSMLIPPRIIQVWKEKLLKPDLKNKTTGLVEWNSGSTITQLIKNILLVDFKITNALHKFLGIKLPGLSNYILCKKRA